MERDRSAADGSASIRTGPAADVFTGKSQVNAAAAATRCITTDAARLAAQEAPAAVSAPAHFE